MTNYEPQNRPHQVPPQFQTPGIPRDPFKRKRSLGANIAIGCAIVLAIILALIALLIGTCMMGNLKFGG